jgi:FKBP-type peptidyl-prolyl cis-trans isomerase FklB
MKKIVLVLTFITSVNYIFAQNDTTNRQSELTNETDSLSYAAGVGVAMSLMSAGIDSLNLELVLEALKDMYENGRPKMDPNAANLLITKFVSKKQQEKATEAASEGIKFLEENKKKEGVVTTESGLQYKVIKEGTGPKPVDGQKVKTHYEGRLIDGTKFDSSYDRGEPTSFGINQVIKGWTEALKLMSVGSKYELYIPYQLAYGERGTGGSIPPYATLIFTVELLDIES